MLCARGSVALAAAWLAAACTEPNPYADEGSTSSAATTNDATATTSDDASESHEASEDGSDDMSGTTGVTACQLGTHVCVAAPPMGWSGPVAIVDDAPSDPATECAGAYAEGVAVAYSELDAPAATCECDCGEPDDADCDPQLIRDNTAGCGSPSMTWNLGLSCFTGVTGTANQYWAATAGELTGTCTPSASEEIVEPVFTQRHTLCAPAVEGTGACEGDDVCAPIPIAPFGDALCIWTEGDDECPADLGYDDRRTLFRDVTDTRACSECTCGLEGECTGSVYLFDIDGCDDDFVAGTVVFDGACIQVAPAIEEARISMSWTVDASCAVTGGGPEGEAVGADPITMCCRS